jgi:hypothetical protein
MFGRWLGLLRRGPDLLRASSLGADPDAVEPGARDVQPAQHSGALLSRDANAQIKGHDPAEGHARPIYDP